MDIRSGDNTPDGDFDEAVEFRGRCTNEGCNRTFLKTYLDPVYSELNPDNELNDAFRESIRSQKYED